MQRGSAGGGHGLWALSPGRASPLELSPHEPDQPVSFSPRGTSSVVWLSREQQPRAQVCMKGWAVEGLAGVRWKNDCVAPAGHEAPETDTAERRVGTAVGRSDVWFRFKEGVSNAVRRSLYIRDLL